MDHLRITCERHGDLSQLQAAFLQTHCDAPYYNVRMARHWAGFTFNTPHEDGVAETKQARSLLLTLGHTEKDFCFQMLSFSTPSVLREGSLGSITRISLVLLAPMTHYWSVPLLDSRTNEKLTR